MAGKVKTKYKFFGGEAGDDTDPNNHRYEPAEFNAWGKDKGISQVAFHEYPKIPTANEVYFFVKADSGSKKYMQETAQGLLEAGGFKGVSLKEVGSSDFAVSMKVGGPADVIRAICAMATDAPKGRNDTHFALLDKAIAREIVEMELKRANLTPTQAGLVKVTQDVVSEDRLKAYGMQDKFTYTDVDLSRAPGFFPVASMREDGTPASAFAKNVFYVTTTMELTSEAAADVKAALTKAGIKVKETADPCRIRAEAPVDHVAETLGKAGLLPPAVVAEIAAVAEKGHAKQRDINAEVDKKPAVSAPAARRPVGVKPK